MEFKLNEYHRNITDEELLDDVRRVSDIYKKKTLTQEEYVRYGKYGKNTYFRHFRSWNTVLELCGLSPNVFQLAASKGKRTLSHVTDDQLIDDIQRVSRLLNSQTFSSSDYNTHGLFSKEICFKRFGTWNNTLTVAGLRPYEKVSGKKISTDKLFEEIERMWIKLGRQPTVTDIKDGVSKYSLNTFTRRFGGWRNTLECFIAYMSGDIDMNEIKTSSTSTSITNPVKENKPGKEVPIVCNQGTENIRHKTVRDVNLRLRFRVLQRDNFKCCMCGASPAKDPSVNLEVDHIFPWEKGGETVIDNLQTLCKECNKGKSNLV